MGCGASAGKADEPAAAAPAPSQGKKEKKKKNENLVSDMVKDMGSNVKEGGFGRQFFINSQSGRLDETYEVARNIYLVMELCTGGELFDRIIEANYFSERVAAFLIRQVLSAVFYMHSQNI